MIRNSTPVPFVMKVFLVILLASLAVQVSGGTGLAAPAFPQAGTPALPLLCSYNVSQRYCDLRVVLLIDDTGSMRSNDPTLMRNQAAKNLVDILYQEYYQPALDAQAADPGVTLPDIRVAVIHFSHCVSSNPSDNCGDDAKFNSGWLPITQRENLYSAIDWLKTQPNFYRLKQYTHFAEPFQAASDLFNQPEAGSTNDCVRRAILLLTDGTPEEAAGPLSEPELGNEMGRVKNVLKSYSSESGNHIYVTAFKIVPRYWQAAEPYWKDIAGSSNVSLENSLDGVASRMEKIAAAEIGAQSTTLSPDPKDPRLYRIQVLHHVKSLRLTYYKLDPNATLILTDPQGDPLIPDGETVTQTGQGTAIEVWTLNAPLAGTYQARTSARSGIITTISLYALSLQLDAPTPAKPLLLFTDGEIRFRVLDSRNQPVLPTDDPDFDLNLQASLTDESGQTAPLALTQDGQGYRTVWMPARTAAVRVHVTAELTDLPNHSLWRCEGEGNDLPVDPVGLRVEPPSACTPANTPVTIPLQLIDTRTGQDTAIDLPVHWQASAATVPGGQPVETSVDEVDLKTGAYKLTLGPVIAENVESHLTAGVVADGKPINFYDDHLTVTVCAVPPPPPPSCTACNGYWNYLWWLLLAVLVVLSLARMMFRKKGEKYSRPFWLLIILLILLILIWLLWCCRFLFWPLLILLLILLVILLLLRLIGRDGERKSAYPFWLLLILLVLLMLIWLILFGGYWVYLFLMLLALLAILLWVWFRSRNRNEQEPFPSWLFLILLIVLVSIWLIFFGKFTFWLALILLLVWLAILLLAWLFSQESNWRSSYRFWSLILLLLVLILVWSIYFSGYRIYLFWLLILLLLLWLAAWLLYQYSNPLWGVLGIADRRNRILWSARLARPDGSGGKSYYVWNFKNPICTVRRIRLRSWDQREGWLVLNVTTTGGKRTFRRTLEEWRDCDLGAGCRITWQEKARPTKRAGPRRPKSGGGRKPRPTRYDVEQIEGVGRVYAARLKRLGIHTTDELLKAAGSRKGRKQLAQEIGLSVGRILEWVNRADLMRVPGVGEEYGDLLEAGGVDTVKELRQRNPDNLWDALHRVNEKKRLVRRMPTLEEMHAWVALAKKMKAVVQY